MRPIAALLTAALAASCATPATKPVALDSLPRSELIAYRGMLDAALNVPAGQAAGFPAAEPDETTVSCPNGSTATINIAQRPAVAVYLGNSSATCVRVGGSTVSSTTGYSIGSGCRDGIGVRLPMIRAFCTSSGGAPVVVDAIFEKAP